MTDKQQPPERIWIDPRDSTFWNDTGDVKSLIPYARVQPVDEARVGGARARLRQFFNGKEDYTIIARHFKDDKLNRDITGDVEDLVTLPQLSSSGPRLKDGRAESRRCTCGHPCPSRYERDVKDAQCKHTPDCELMRGIATAPTESDADSIVQPGRGPRVCRECGHLKLNCKCVFPEPAGEEQDDTATLAAYRQEYERLFNWRDLWGRLSNSRRFKLATQNERVEEKAARANRLIGKLIADYDATPAPPLAPPEPPISSERCCAWTLTEIDNPWYQTACGRETDGFDGGYCTYCGGVITINGRRTEAVAATGASEADQREDGK